MNPLPAAGRVPAGDDPPPPVASPHGRATPVGERLIEGLLWACAMVSVATMLAMVAMLALETAGFVHEVGLSALFLDVEWAPRAAEPHLGVWPLVTGTLLIGLTAMTLAAPLGLLAALYLAELAPARPRSVLEPLLGLLAAVPTVVYGYVALAFVTPLLQPVLPSLGRFNALAPGLVLGVMVLPMVAALSTEALRAVPAGVREAAHGLGATPLATLFRVVLPAAAPGVTASVILATSRAVGETMIVAIAAGQRPQLTFDPRDPVETMTTYILQASLGEASSGVVADGALFVVGALLLAMTLTMNAFGLRLVRRLGVRW